MSLLLLSLHLSSWRKHWGPRQQVPQNVSNYILTWSHIPDGMNRGPQILGAGLPKQQNFVPNICGSQILNLLLVTLQAPRILRWLLEFWKMWTPGLESLVSCCLRKCNGDLQKRTEPFFDSNSHNYSRFPYWRNTNPLPYFLVFKFQEVLLFHGSV